MTEDHEIFVSLVYVFLSERRINNCHLRHVILYYALAMM